MTDKQFWNKLDQITNKKQTIKTTQEFLKILTEGYSQELNILIYGVGDPNDGDTINQACIITNGEKTMMYLTDKRHEKNCKIAAPIYSMYQPKCWEVNVCDVINNAIEKKEVTTLIFNHDTKNMYVIPKFLLIAALMRYTDIPM